MLCQGLKWVTCLYLYTINTPKVSDVVTTHVPSIFWNNHYFKPIMIMVMIVN